MKFFCSGKKLLLFFEDNKIHFENYFNNKRGIIAKNTTDRFCIDMNTCSVLYRGVDGNLYDVNFNENGSVNEICILEKKSGNGEITPYSVINTGNQKYYIYILQNSAQEQLIAIQKATSVPETVVSANKLIFDVGFNNNIISFAFVNENKIIIKNYNCNAEKFEDTYIINTDFKEISKLKCIYNDVKISIIAAGVSVNDTFEIIDFDENGASNLYSCDFNNTFPENIYITKEKMIIESTDKYIDINIKDNKMRKEYFKNEAEIIFINTCGTEKFVILSNNEKPKLLLEKFVSIENNYNKYVKRIELLKKEIDSSKKQINNIYNELNKLC